MPQLNSHAYKNIQSIVAQLFVLALSDNSDATLELISETICSESKNMAAAGLEYIHNVISTNQQEEEQEQEEEEEEEQEEEEKKSDWKDREEQDHAYN